MPDKEEEIINLAPEIPDSQDQDLRELFALHDHNPGSRTARPIRMKINDLTDVNMDSVTQGDILYIDSNLEVVNLGPGTSGQFLKTQGASANPAWASLTVPRWGIGEVWNNITGITSSLVNKYGGDNTNTTWNADGVTISIGASAVGRSHALPAGIDLLQFDPTLCFNFQITSEPTGGSNIVGVIMGNFAYGGSGAVTSEVVAHIGFLFKYNFPTPGALLLQASNADGTTQTTTTVTGVTATDDNLYEIRYTSTSITFYVNGVLKATHTTNIPTSITTSYIQIGMSRDGGSGTYTTRSRFWSITGDTA